MDELLYPEEDVQEEEVVVDDTAESLMRELMFDDKVVLGGGFDLDVAMVESVEMEEELGEEEEDGTAREINEHLSFGEMEDEDLPAPVDQALLQKKLFSEEDLVNVEEPSAIANRLESAKEYNVGEWSSKELTELYHGIREYGSSADSLMRILSQSVEMKKKRDIGELMLKVADIRDLNVEHRETKIKFEKFIMRRHPAFSSALQPEFAQLRFVWSTRLRRLMDMRTCTRRNDPVRDVLRKFFEERSIAMKQETTTIQDLVGDRVLPINWSRVYRQIYNLIFAAKEKLAKKHDLNPIESLMVLTCMEEMETLASKRMTEAKRSEYRGILHNLIRSDTRHFELPLPLSDNSHMQPFMDPLNLELWEKAELAEESGEAILKQMHFENLLTKAAKEEPKRGAAKRKSRPSKTVPVPVSSTEEWEESNVEDELESSFHESDEEVDRSESKAKGPKARSRPTPKRTSSSRKGSEEKGRGVTPTARGNQQVAESELSSQDEPAAKRRKSGRRKENPPSGPVCIPPGEEEGGNREEDEENPLDEMADREATVQEDGTNVLEELE